MLSAERPGVERVVHFSSAKVFGFAEGEGTPDCLPVDDDHPLHASHVAPVVGARHALITRSSGTLELG